VDVTASEPAARRCAGLLQFVRTPLTAAEGLVLATGGVALGTFLLLGSPSLHGARWLPVFQFLFRRNEPAAALWSCIIVVCAWAAARWLPSIGTRIPRILTDRPYAFVLLVTAVCAVAALLVYRGYPLSMDEYAPLFQAEAFARGSLTGRVPPELLPRLAPTGDGWFFEGSPNGQIISVYWPGFALLLTPFAALRCPWLLNPLVGGASLLILWRLAKGLWPDSDAPGWAVLLAAASPAFIVNAISLYSMPAHLLASLCFALLLQVESPRRLLAAGAIGSLALALHNPLPHTLFALPFIVAIAAGRDRIRNLALLGAGYLPGALLFGAGWLWVRGNVREQMGIGQGPGQALGAGLKMAFHFPSADVLWARTVNFSELALWAVPVLLPLACAGAWAMRREKAPRLLAWSALATFCGYLFVRFDQGHGWGYRYFHAAWGVLPLLAGGYLAGPKTSSVVRRLALVASLCALVVLNGLRLRQVGTFVDRHLRQIPTAPTQARFEVVFVKIDRGYYSIDLIQNDPMLEGNRWILRSLGDAEDERFMRRSFPRARLAIAGPVASVWQMD